MNAEVVKGIIATILLVFGFLLIRKSGKWPFGKQNIVIGLLLLVLALYISLQALIEDPGDVFMVFATLVLAGAAILTFIQNRVLNENNRKREEKDRGERGEREQRERSERLVREQRDRTDKMLEVISAWAKEVQTIILGHRQSEITNIKNLLSKMYSLKSERIGLIKIAETIDEELAIDMKFENEDDSDKDLLDSFIGILGYIISVPIDIDSPHRVVEYLYNMGDIDEYEYPYPEKLETATRELIEKVSKKRAELITP